MACAGRIRASEDLPIERALGQLLEREIEQLEMIAALFAPAFPGLRIPASTSRPQVTSSGLNPNPPL